MFQGGGEEGVVFRKKGLVFWGGGEEGMVF